MSTKAAAEYLATLHDEAGDDWPMTLVAWNNGDRAIDRYWSLRGPNIEKFGNRLPRRTRGLLGRFMAVAYIAHHADSYGITPVKLDDPPAYQILPVSGGTPLGRVALNHGTTLQRLHELNPALLRDVVPPYERSYSVRVPLDSRIPTPASSTSSSKFQLGCRFSTRHDSRWRGSIASESRVSSSPS